MGGGSAVFLFLSEELFHKRLVDGVQLLVAVQGGEDLLPVLLDGLQDDKAQFLFRGLLPLLLGGEEGQVGLAVPFDGVQMLQLELVAILIGDGDEIRAVFFAHMSGLLCCSVCIVPRQSEKSKPAEGKSFGKLSWKTLFFMDRQIGILWYNKLINAVFSAAAHSLKTNDSVRPAAALSAARRVHAIPRNMEVSNWTIETLAPPATGGTSGTPGIVGGLAPTRKNGKSTAGASGS